MSMPSARTRHRFNAAARCAALLALLLGAPGLCWSAAAASAAAPAHAAAPAGVPAARVRATPPPRAAAAPAGVHLGPDYFVHGDHIDLPADVAGDALAAGNNVRGSGSVGGDLVVAAGNVEVSGKVAHTAYLAGGQIELDGHIDGNARLAGQLVQLAHGAQIAGGVTVAGRVVRVDGQVGSYLVVVGEAVRIDGHVGGNTIVIARELDLGPHALIDGSLRYERAEVLNLAHGAQVRGGMTQLPLTSPDTAFGYGTMLRLGGWLMLLGWLLVAALALGVWPQFTVSVSSTVRRRLGACVLLGAAVLIITPICAALLCLSVLGIPLALLMLFLYLLVVPLGYLSASMALGDWLLMRLRPQHVFQAASAWRLLTLTVILILLHLIRGMPIFGAVLRALVLVSGIGGLVLASSSHLRSPPLAPEVVMSDAPVTPSG